MSRRAFDPLGFSASVFALASLLSCNPAPATSDDGPADLSTIPPTSPPDFASVAGDSVPAGAVAFFQRKDCPQGWEKLGAASGRTLVPTVGADPVDVSVGTPLQDSEERSHSHAISGTINLSTVGYAGIAGEANHGLARGGANPLTGTATKSAASLPYIQLVVCHKTAEADPQLRPLAAGTLVFFKTKECPSGFVQAGASQGRFIVGLPERATAGQKFGGAPLKSGENRTHHHNLSGSITTSSHGIALANGGTASGYAKNDQHPFQQDSADDSIGFPFLQLRHCQKQ